MTKNAADESVCCEAYGPAGAALIVTCRGGAQPDRARLRAVLDAHGALSGAAGSVAYLFRTVGVITCKASPRLAAAATRAGAEDVRDLGDGRAEVLTDPAETDMVRARLAAGGFVVTQAAVLQRAAQGLAVDADAAAHLRALVTALHDIDGVSGVYTNAALP